MKSHHSILISILGLLFISGCSSFLDPETNQDATGNQLDNLDKITITNVLIQGLYAHTGAYQGEHDLFGIMSINLAGDLSTEDMLTATFHHFSYDYLLDNRNANYNRTNKTWGYCYTLIAKANEVIAQIDPETPNANLQANLGQALALRAQGLHTLIQRYQQTYIGNEEAPGVPIYLTDRDDAPSVHSRGSVQQVYNRIFKDLLSALHRLEGFKRGNKTMIDKNVAAGLLARAYLSAGEWEAAAQYARMARKGYAIMSAEEAGKDGYNDINNVEWMWGFDTNSENTRMVASFQSHMSTFDPGYAGAAGAYKVIDKKLFSQMAEDDTRRNLYITDHKNYPFGTNNKFKSTPAWLSDNPYMRVSEMILIEAEALAHQQKNVEAAAVLKELMSKRVPSWSQTTVDVEDVFLQKRLELWGEGVIFYDYLRLKKGINRNYPGTNHSYTLNLPGGDWRFLYQIPQDEMDNNSELSYSDQNP